MKTPLVLVLFLFLVSCVSTNQIAATETYLPTEATTFNTPTETATYIPPTSTPELFDVQVLAFWDYNGNGFFDEGEPPLEGIVSKVGNFECTTGVDGSCIISVSEGNFTVIFHTTNGLVNGNPVSGLDYLFYETDVLKPTSGYKVEVTENMTTMVALGQGFFTIPVGIESFGGASYNFGKRYWDGSILGYRTHLGYDILIKGNGPQPIYAPVSGFLEPDPDGGWGKCNNVNIRYKKMGLDLVIGIGHLTKVIVKPNQEIIKGEIIGFINPDLFNPGFVACTSVPHVHIGFWGSVNGQANKIVEGKVDGDLMLVAKGEWGWIDPAYYFPKRDEPMPYTFLSQKTH